VIFTCIIVRIAIGVKAMGVWPVPEEIIDMARGIDNLGKVVEAQSTILEKMLVQMTEMKTAVAELKGLGGKIDALHGTLTTAKDALRMLCTVLERKH
jgi:hypothetical protein